MMPGRCPWYIAGPLLGVLMVGLRAAIKKPFGALGGYIDVAERARTPARLGVAPYLLVGLTLGGALFAILSGHWGATFEYDSAGGPLATMTSAAQFALLALAGVAIGFGARTSGGCTSGHGLSGLSLGSPASLVASMTFFGTAVAMARLVAWLAGTRS